MATATFIDEVTRHLRRALEERRSSYAEHGRSLEEIGPPEELARRMVGVVPEPSRWDDLLGPFYTTSKVAEILGGVSRQAIADRRERHTLLALKTAEGTLVYPTFQFDDHNEVLAGLPEVLQCFRGSGIDDWTLAGWLVSKFRTLDGRSPVDWLRLGREPEPVLRLARAAASQGMGPRLPFPRKQIEDFCQRWNITELAAFGSVLRDDFKPGSDVDVLVTFAADTHWTLFDMARMRDELSRILAREVDLLSRRGVEASRNPIRREAILSSAQVIYAA